MEMDKSVIGEIRMGLGEIKELDENKRKDAMDFLKEVTETLAPVGVVLWGAGPERKHITEIGNQFFLRYEEVGAKNKQKTGFYMKNTSTRHYDDIHMTDIHGQDFWDLVGVVASWLATVHKKIGTLKENRQQLIHKIESGLIPQPAKDNA